jgi:glycerol-3-phosphate dehydrogenase
MDKTTSGRINPLDTRQRAAALAALGQEEYDLLVIGGGITGAGIALDAAARGLKVALVEMQDYAAGTSSRSTKLIHGGLRYLKQFEFRLVAEVGRERAILHRNAQHVVLPEQLLLPVIQGGTFGYWGVAFGLWLYDRLAGVKAHERRQMLNLARTRTQEPLLGTPGLKAAGLYSEYRTDDARLTIAVIKSAVAQGAMCLNHLEVVDFGYHEGQARSAVLQDRLDGSRHAVRARWIVNAAGPWVDGLRKLDKSLEGKRLHHTKGVHLVVPFARLPIKQSVYFDIPDGRMMFAIPRQPWTYLGTTDTNYQGDLGHPRVTQADVDYLLGATNAMFPAAALTVADIKSSWAGIRPLIHEEGKSPSQLSRKDELFISRSGLISIAGGKLTGFRKMAERVVDLVVAKAKEAGRLSGAVPCTTDQIMLSGGDFPKDSDLAAIADGWAKTYQVDPRETRWLMGLYGSDAPRILAAMDRKLPDARLALVLAALDYSIAEEGVASLDDFFTRRTALLYFGREWIAPVLEAVRTTLEAALAVPAGADPDGVFARNYRDAVEFP